MQVDPWCCLVLQYWIFLRPQPGWEESAEHMSDQPKKRQTKVFYHLSQHWRSCSLAILTQTFRKCDHYHQVWRRPKKGCLLIYAGYAPLANTKHWTWPHCPPSTNSGYLDITSLSPYGSIWWYGHLFLLLTYAHGLLTSCNISNCI